MKTGSLSVVLQFLRRQHAASELATVSDRHLLARFVEHHDQEAFAVLMRRHADLVFHVCQRLLNNWQDSEDAFQATFLVLARKAATISWQESIAGWLHEVACRVAAEARGTLSRRRLREKQVDPMPELGYEHHHDRAEITSLVDEELRHLPEAYRTPVILCCLQGLSRDEAAVQLGCTVGVVKGRLERGRRMLADRLSRRGIAVAGALAAIAVPAAGTAQASPELMQQTLDLSASFAHGLPAPASPAVDLATKVLRGLSRGWVVSACAALGMVFVLSGAAVGVATTQTEPRPAITSVSSQSKGEAEKKAKGAEPKAVVVHEHRDVIRAVVLTPDGKTAISASFDGTVHVWDAATGKLEHSWKTESTNSALALSPDGRTLVAGNAVGDLFFWDMKTHEEIATRNTGEGNVYNLTFSPDGKKLASANHKGSLSLWNPKTGANISTFMGHKGRVWSVSFSPDGKKLASAGEDGSVRVWDPETGKELLSTKIHTDYTCSVAFSPDGKRLATLGYDDRLFILDTETGKKLSETQVPSGACVLFSPDGKTLLTTDRVGNFHIWSADKIERLQTGSKHEKAVHHAAISRDGKRVVTGSEDGRAISWELDPPGKSK